jgi:hypothetical protein
MNGETKLSELTVNQFNTIIKTVSSTYIEEACKKLQDGCKRNWNNDINEFAEKITGLDTTTAVAKDHLRGVYKYAEGLKSKSKVITNAIILKLIEWLFIAGALYLGLKGKGV